MKPRTGYLAGFVLALVATSGSLYYSEVLGFPPCRLCWYQRVLMYPQVALFGVGAWRGGRDLLYASLPLTVVGVGVAAFHSYYQVALSGSCGLVSCATVYVRLFGVFSIPNQSLVAFLGLVGVSVALLRTGEWSAASGDGVAETRGFR